MRSHVWLLLLSVVATGRFVWADDAAGVVVERGMFPNRVHVVEDYETEIEKRWWLRGTPEVKNVPEGSTRACRASESGDFDDKQGDPKAKYNAVVFNPVPGPPMGKNTRLSFKYWVKGSGELRVQIYSLTNGYHRRLMLSDLPQEKWQAVTVDMTKARRPDGTGGALAEDERIDDIQFYVRAGVELIIDDIVLFDAAVEGETRPFPKRVIFTGWFDTGKQGEGKEWPGRFEIVEHGKPRTWKAARSVPGAKGLNNLDLNLRGARPVSARTCVWFRYRLDNAGGMDVFLGSVEASGAPAFKSGEWTSADIEFDTAAVKSVDELLFRVPQRGQLLIDDVLVYEAVPAEK